MPIRAVYPAMLDCRHTIILNPPPMEGDEVLCRRCAKYRMVLIVATEWSIRCDECRYGRRHGADEAAARRAASKHADSRMHDIWIRFGGKAIELVNPAGHDSHFPTVNRWLRGNPAHQGRLRGIGS